MFAPAWTSIDHFAAIDLFWLELFYGPKRAPVEKCLLKLLEMVSWGTSFDNRCPEYHQPIAAMRLYSDLVCKLKCFHPQPEVCLPLNGCLLSSMWFTRDVGTSGLANRITTCTASPSLNCNLLGVKVQGESRYASNIMNLLLIPRGSRRYLDPF